MIVFDTFFESTCKLQSTCSPRLPNGFWCFLVQNKAEALLVLFLRFVYHFCLLKTGETFKRSLELGFFPCQFWEKHKWPEVAVVPKLRKTPENRKCPTHPRLILGEGTRLPKCANFQPERWSQRLFPWNNFTYHRLEYRERLGWVDGVEVTHSNPRRGVPPTQKVSSVELLYRVKNQYIQKKVIFHIFLYTHRIYV